MEDGRFFHTVLHVDVMSFEGRHLARNVRCSMFRCAVLSPCLAMCLKISAGEVHECWQHFHRSARPFHFLRAAAKSTIPHHLADLLIFSPGWDVADYPFQPQYYYQDRNGLMKFMDLLYGKYGGCSDDFQPCGAHMAVRAFFRRDDH